MAAKKSAETTIEIQQITRERVRYHIVGSMPVICNRMSQKVKGELLLPKGRKSAADKAHTLKHSPIDEFMASPYTHKDEDAQTYLAALSIWFKKGIAGAAVDIPGATKAQLGRLMWVEGERLPLWGIPFIHMSVTRSADMNRTPDIRTRAIVPQWATIIEVSYMVPVLREPAISGLLAAAGMIQGIGDWRPQKGSGTYGQFRICDQDDPDFKNIVKTGGRQAQIDAMAEPCPYDEETEELLSWYEDECVRRGIKEVKKAC